LCLAAIPKLKRLMPVPGEPALGESECRNCFSASRSIDMFIRPVSFTPLEPNHVCTLAS